MHVLNTLAQKYRNIYNILLVLTSFYAYMVFNNVLYVLYNWLITGVFPVRRLLMMYGHCIVCKANSLSWRYFAALGVVLLMRLLCTTVLPRIKFLQFTMPFLITVTLMDLVYVVVQMLPVPINLNYYFNTSFWIVEGDRFGYPNWLIFALVGSVFSYLLKQNLKLTWADIGQYFLIALASFGFQLLVYYVMWKKIMLL